MIDLTLAQFAQFSSLAVLYVLATCVVFPFATRRISRIWLFALRNRLYRLSAKEPALFASPLYQFVEASLVLRLVAVRRMWSFEDVLELHEALHVSKDEKANAMEDKTKESDESKAQRVAFWFPAGGERLAQALIKLHEDASIPFQWFAVGGTYRYGFFMWTVLPAIIVGAVPIIAAMVGIRLIRLALLMRRLKQMQRKLQTLVNSAEEAGKRATQVLEEEQFKLELKIPFASRIGSGTRPASFPSETITSWARTAVDVERTILSQFRSKSNSLLLN